jgi:hypothetical protein
VFGVRRKVSAADRKEERITTRASEVHVASGYPFTKARPTVLVAQPIMLSFFHPPASTFSVSRALEEVRSACQGEVDVQV